MQIDHFIEMCKKGGAVVVVDGQYGSTGKGKVVVGLTSLLNRVLPGKVSHAVRCGGPNAGHTVYFKDVPYVTRQIPSAMVLPNIQLVIAAGAMVDPNLLLRELSEIETLIGLNSVDFQDVTSRLVIDSQTALVSDTEIFMEKEMKLGHNIGSTVTGTGATAANRALRKVRLAGEAPNLIYPISAMPDTFALLNWAIKQGKVVMVEGTQGFGLSLYHSGHYPFVTSKDTTASTFLAEAGIGPKACAAVVMAIRTYPIRVGGNSGPIYREIDWGVVAERSGRTGKEPLVEMTSVTKKIRRVGEFDWGLVQRACEVNKPDYLVVHGMDYLNHSASNASSMNQLPKECSNFIFSLELRLKIPVLAVFTGKHQESIIWL